ncbi:elongation of very long chain fatty acids protein 7-like, partial [Nothobranchius furzeri]
PLSPSLPTGGGRRNRWHLCLAIASAGHLSCIKCFQFLVTSWLSNYILLCQPVDYSTSPLAMRMARGCWWFFLSKVIELSDTLFFILRKKNSQLTFLHVYHHGTMIFNCWAGVKHVTGQFSPSSAPHPAAFFVGLVNSFVHIIMYSYYGLAAIGPHMQKYLWWKRYLTSLQLVSKWLHKCLMYINYWFILSQTLNCIYRCSFFSSSCT